MLPSRRRWPPPRGRADRRAPDQRGLVRRCRTARAARLGAATEGRVRTVACTHGHEVGWSMVPGARRLLRRIAATNDVLTFVSRYSRRRISPRSGRRRRWSTCRRASTEHLPAGPGGPRGDPRPARPRRPRRLSCACPDWSPRKGQDALIRRWPRSRDGVPDARLLIVGGGPLRRNAGSVDRADISCSTVSSPDRCRGRRCRVLRGGRRVRHAVPDPRVGAGRRGPRHRVPGGVGHRPAGDRRRLRSVRPRRSGRNAPDWSSTAGTSARSPPRACGCCPTGDWRPRCGRAGRAWVGSRPGPGTGSADRLVALCCRAESPSVER